MDDLSLALEGANLSRQGIEVELTGGRTPCEPR